MREKHYNCKIKFAGNKTYNIVQYLKRELDFFIYIIYIIPYYPIYCITDVPLVLVI